MCLLSLEAQTKAINKMIDQDGDGLISEKDLRDMLASLGACCSQNCIATPEST
jgi:Ca2+-binding EF-hand superfamily protein